MNIPNYLTFSRLFISPLFLLIYSQHAFLGITSFTLPYILLLLLSLSEFSDMIDGYIARKYNQVTDFGKIFDPMADSIYRTTVFLTLTLPPVELPIILIFIFLYRDSVIGTLRTMCALQGHALSARPSGKLKAVIQAVATFLIIFLLIPYSLGILSLEDLQQWSMYAATIASLYSFFSGIEYLLANRIFIRALISKQSSACVD